MKTKLITLVLTTVIASTVFGRIGDTVATQTKGLASKGFAVTGTDHFLGYLRLEWKYPGSYLNCLFENGKKVGFTIRVKSTHDADRIMASYANDWKRITSDNQGIIFMSDSTDLVANYLLDAHKLFVGYVRVARRMSH